MTSVIAFPKRNRETSEINKQFGPAQVIIFTGVRQERLQEEAIVRLRRARKARLPSRQNQATAEELA
jgi:hypothetical protein